MVLRFDNKDGRMRGRKLQERRLRVWTADPHCAMCGGLVEFSARPGFGFELDHKKALKADGGQGEDIEENTQVLCCGPEGCHRKKTDRDMKHAKPTEFTSDGRVVW